MAKARTRFYPELGQHFKDLRERKKFSFRGAVDRAADRGLVGVTKSNLERIEKGEFKFPPPVLIASLSTLYGVDVEDLKRRVVDAQEALPVVSKSRRMAGQRKSLDRITPEPSAATGGGDADRSRKGKTARDRVEELRDALDEAEELAGAVFAAINHVRTLTRRTIASIEAPVAWPETSRGARKRGKSRRPAHI